MLSRVEFIPQENSLSDSVCTSPSHHLATASTQLLTHLPTDAENEFEVSHGEQCTSITKESDEGREAF